MVELWAYCADCQRWYYCCPAMRRVSAARGRNPINGDDPLPDCPVCQSSPTGSRIERETPEPLHS